MNATYPYHRIFRHVSAVFYLGLTVTSPVHDLERIQRNIIKFFIDLVMNPYRWP